MVAIDLHKKLQNQECKENGNVRTHFDTMMTMREEMASMGEEINDEDFANMLLGLMPKSYENFISSLMATIDKYNRRMSKKGKGKDHDIALHAGEKPKKNDKKKDSNIECFNCHKKGHKKADCWSKGGGKEGQGPKSKKGKEKTAESAKAANNNEDSMWLAYLDDNTHNADNGLSHNDDVEINAEDWGWE